MWDLETGQNRLTIDLPRPSFLLPLPNEILAVATNRHVRSKIILVYFTTGKKVDEFQSYNKNISRLILLDQPTMASCSYPYFEVSIWDLTNGQILRTIDPGPEAQDSIFDETAFQFKNDILATRDDFYKLKLWKWQTGEHITTLNFKPGVSSIGFLKKSKFLATTEKICAKQRNRLQSIELWDFDF
jgi:WD40 repeat protein